MFKTFYHLILFIVLFLVNSQVNAAFILDKTPNIENLPAVKFDELCQVAKRTLQYIEQNNDDDFAVHGGAAILPFSNTQRIKNTLAFICQIQQQSKLNESMVKLADAHFLKQHFDFYRWLPDKATANKIAEKSTNARKQEMLRDIPKEQIFLTKYYTKLLDGSPVKTKKFTQALYGLPFDEQDLSIEQAEYKKANLTRFKYTRQQIIAGALSEKSLAKPLVWITEEALHDVLLQGTGVLKVNGQIRYFNVHRNNGIAYDYQLGKREQARYWYFAEVPSIMGYGKNLASKIAILPYVTFAGNVKQLGLGQFFLVNNAQAKTSFNQLGILADQGGAFDNNLFQLDYLVGNYRGWSDYHQANKHLPDYTNAWLLLKKE